MSKDGRQHSDDAPPVRLEVVPRRGLSRQEAARYVGIGTTEFDELVCEGQMTQPFRIGSRTIWDLRKLDAAFDRLSGPEEADSFADWDTQPEKAQTHRSPIPARKDAKRKALARGIPSKEHPGHPHVYTADTLTAHWMCSAGLVRKLVQRGELTALMSGPPDASDQPRCRDRLRIGQRRGPEE